MKYLKYDGGRPRPSLTGIRGYTMNRVRFLPGICLLLVLCLAAALPAPANAAESRSGIVQNYKNMLTAFDRGSFQVAYALAQEIYREDPRYEEIDSYYHYLLAKEEYLPAGRYADAYNEFEVLAISSFAQSAGYAGYARGLLYEADQAYENAVAAYEEAIKNGIGEAQERIRLCRAAERTLYDEATKLAAQGDHAAAAEKYMRIAGYQDALEQAYACYYLVAGQKSAEGKFREAAEAYAQLAGYKDADDKARENYYLVAGQLSAEEKYSEAAELFSQLGDYRDAREKAAENKKKAEEINNPANLGLTLVRADVTSLSLTWKDQGAASYQISYAPTGLPSLKKSFEQAGVSCVIEGLVPNTDYTVAVTAMGGGGRGEGSFFTVQAGPADADKYSVRSVYLCSYNASLQGMGLLNIMNTRADGMYKELSEGMERLTRRPGRSGDRYFAYCTFFRMEREPATYTITYALRLDGKYSAAVTFTAECGTESFPYFPVDVTEALDAFYEDRGGEGSVIYVDAYLDGLYLCTQAVEILE